MKQILAMIVLGLSLLLTAGANCWAAENLTKQLETLGSYEEASRSAGSQQPAANQDLQAQADKLTHEFRMRQENIKLYEIAILSALALISLIIVLRFIAAKTDYSGSHIVTATGLIFIIFGTIMLVIMSENEEQMTAAIGILGAIAGYLFGAITRGKYATEAKEER
jgi:hypothetical protein